MNIAIFVSGSGSNCENIIQYFQNNKQANIALVVSNRSDAYALVRAQRLNVPTKVLPKAEFNNQEMVMKLMADYRIDFIVLAGFLLMIPDWLISAYQHRMINLHPALLPKFGGIGMYGGEIIAQFRTPITPDDTPDDIAAKEHVLEMKHFPQVIEAILKQEKLIQ